jgi:RNA polymerase sigma-70 factor (ECF subfamily)
MTSSQAVSQLAQSRERFLRFIHSRIGDPERAEDVLQAALEKAATGIRALRSEDSLVPWFYSVLRNAINDSYRERARVHEVPLPPTLDLAEDEPEAERQLCHCFEAILPALKPEYADLIEAIDLKGEASTVVAVRLGITPNNLKVRHHRARQALRGRLEETCRVCAEHHCLDCTCGR